MIDEAIKAQLKPGVKVRVYEGRIPFTGIIIARKHGNEKGATFTVRSVVKGVGVEKIYPLNSPSITKVEIVATAKRTRRAKLYFIRNLSGKKIRKKLGISI
ncbi:50S ribosomal protein L19 [Candidatus Parcubacteria bacterium]|nr:MAG: 50S ribosomal protein L19 [Candidatus Parcubacteria bacterium]